MKILKLLKKLRTNAYQKYCQQELEEHCILLEAGQGKNINGNCFAMIRELCENKKYAQFKVINVVTEATVEACKQRFAFYGYDVTCVIRGSDEYKKYLACAKYLVTDNSFPPYFMKRKGQVYLNTWHGTPLKTLGISDLKNASSLANIQKNYLMCDYALFPNAFTRDVFLDDYMLRNLYQGEIVLSDYPRNEVFLRSSQSKQLRKQLDLVDKKVYAYMPTWRGSGRRADGASHKEVMEVYFEEIDKQLQDHELLYVNLHFLLGNQMDYSKYQHIKPFPSEYETYDFLAICDALITDYSSVFFDYAITKRKVVLFAYDLEEYMDQRGTYFALEELPFPIVKTTQELVAQLHREEEIDADAYVQFLKKYHHYASVHTSQYVLDLLLENNRKYVEIEKPQREEKPIYLVYAGKLRNEQLNLLLVDYLKELKQNNPDKQIVLAFHGKMHEKKYNTLTQINREVDYYAVVNKFEFSFVQKVIAALKIRFGYFDRKLSGKIRDAFVKERKRMFYGIEPEKVIYFAGNPHYMYRVLSTFECEKEAHVQHNVVMGIVARKSTYYIMYRYFKENYDSIVEHRLDDVHALWNEENKHQYYNRCLRFGILTKLCFHSKKYSHLHAICFAYTILPFSIKNLKVKINDTLYDAHLKQGLHIGKAIRITHMHVKIPHTDLVNMNIHNKIELYYQDQEGYGFKRGIQYQISDFRKGKHKHGPIYMDQATNTSAYYRQSKNNLLYFTVRNSVMSDTFLQQCKINVARILAWVIPMFKVTLLFEKESSRYEESASVLYEQLLDQGYRHVYFILDKNYAHKDQIAQKYLKNIVWKGSFKHYFLFFKAKTFLGSEALVHAIDLRVANRFALYKLESKNINYVFLQHGVMYMVSLDSESRTFFKPKKLKGKYRVVVSSALEQQHFVELGRHKEEQLYVCGLPKFDRNTWNEDADRIVIMPTWRPWEYNEARYECAQTKYYQMIQRMFDAIDEDLKEKVIILPHPLFYDALKESDVSLKSYFVMDEKYDDILKRCKVLITDYSSIAYDAFYRGCNVIFYWEEKDACMEEYGPSTKLMLNKHNVFGDICYSATDLKQVIRRNYEQPQTKQYQEAYQKIVSFHDGNNTKRLIDCLKKDEII